MDDQPTPTKLADFNTAQKRSEFGVLLESSSLEQPETKTPTKIRSFSDSIPSLEPSPKFKEPPTQQSKDDDILLSTPSRTPGRLDISSRSLQLHLPPKDFVGQTGVPPSRALFPTAEQREAYGSPSSAIPRHSRGLSFARARTNLHHSTIADKGSPDSSPTVAQRTAKASSRRPSHSMAIDSPRVSGSGIWPGSWGERGLLSRSLASTSNVFASDASSSSSDDDDTSIRQEDMDDTIMNTPQMRKVDSAAAPTPLWLPNAPVPPGGWGNNTNSPLPPTFRQFRSGSLWKEKSKTSSDSGEGTGRTTSPEPQSTPNEKKNEGSYFCPDVVMSPISRRESLSVGTSGLQISPTEEAGDESTSSASPLAPAVVRRPVTRRSNLLPKTKGFARIRAALQEESTPLDSETRREAEVVKQVRQNESPRERPLPATAPSSPDMMPVVPHLPSEGTDMSEFDALGLTTFPTSSTDQSAPDQRRSSNSREFWPNLYSRSHTPPPPPPLFHRARSSSNMSEDVGMESPHVSTPPSSVLSAVSTQMPDVKAEFERPQQFQPPALPSAADVSRKANKRRRDEDFDPASIKRRAVSPGVSVHSSPVLGQSPVSNTGGWMPQSKGPKEQPNGGSTADERSASSGGAGQTAPMAGLKGLGMMGMTDTSDGMMKMSIE